MKKIFLIAVLVLSISVANAWNNRADEGVVQLASKHLTVEAKAMLNMYLGDSYADDVCYLYDLEKKKTASHSKNIHYLYLNKELQPMTFENCALTEIEKAMEIITAYKSHSNVEVTAALRTVINLMCDIHNLSNVRIEGVPHSQKDFSFIWYKGDIGRWKKTSQITWADFWNSYIQWHSGYSGNIWADELELSLGGRREEFSKGAMQDWVADIGKVAAELYARIIPGYVMTRRERNELEELNCEMMAKTGYRLATLLNEVVK